jgi:hypothetical protein
MLSYRIATNSEFQKLFVEREKYSASKLSFLRLGVEDYGRAATGLTKIK